MHDSAIGRPHKDRPVVIDIYDGDLKTGGAPEGRSAMISRHHSQIKPLKTLQQPQGANQPSVRIQRERICKRERSATISNAVVVLYCLYFPIHFLNLNCFVIKVENKKGHCNLNILCVLVEHLRSDLLLLCWLLSWTNVLNSSFCLSNSSFISTSGGQTLAH